MSGQHTPGPWSIETVATSCGSCHKIGPFPGAGHRREVHACVYADGIRIGMDESNPAAKELLANARLIATAPELLEALTVAREWMRGDKWRNSTVEKHASWEAVMRGIDAAIAKATGAHA